MEKIINGKFESWIWLLTEAPVNQDALIIGPITKIDHSTTSVDPVTYVGSITSNGHITGSSVAF